MIKKIWTSNSVKEIMSNDSVGPDKKNRPCPRTRSHHHRLVNSASCSGFNSADKLLHETHNKSASTHEIIDYHYLTPQVPFMPCIAKSIPKKRILLKKPKRKIKDIFHHKKHSSEKVASPIFKRNKRSICLNQIRFYQNHNDTHYLSDSSSECCTHPCDDDASLKSFGSQAGCGEIFADEEDLLSSKNISKLETPKHIPNVCGFQKNSKQISPGQSEVLDLFGMWETINRTVLLSKSSSHKTARITTPLTSPNQEASSFESVPKRNLNETSDMTTPKSENQESNSDEGYYDYTSSDHTRQSLTPIYNRKFPRDTYSGDALYELFYESCNLEMTSIFDDEVDHSFIGLPSPDLPLSMYSFHVGSEEKLSPPLAVDLNSQDFPQSNWLGKDCLLKLCDTELSLTMGLVNWLKHRTVGTKQEDVAFPEITPIENGNPSLDVKVQTTGITNVPINPLPSTMSQESLADFGLLENHQKQDTSDLHLMSPESQLRTPTSHVCFQILNINSPSAFSGASPVPFSPGSGRSSFIVLAVNKDSLCDSCKNLLKHGATELQLCHICTSFIETVKTSEIWAHPNLYLSAAEKTGEPPVSCKEELLPSPTSSYGIESDISIFSLVEQCANQMSSLRINKPQHISDNQTEVEPKHHEKFQNHARKHSKSKPKKGNLTTKMDIPLIDSNISRSCKDLHHLVPSTQQNSQKRNAASALSPRPTSLSLKSVSSIKPKERPQEREIDKKKTANPAGLLEHVIPKENTTAQAEKKEIKQMM